jgi:hypothetical protein
VLSTGIVGIFGSRGHKGLSSLSLCGKRGGLPVLFGLKEKFWRVVLSSERGTGYVSLSLVPGI